MKKITLTDHLKMFLQTPKAYIYAYRYSNSDTVKFTPYQQNNFRLAKDIEKIIKLKIPTAQVYLIGSTGLGILGKGDIDIFVTVPKKRNKAISVINSIFGQSRKIRKDFVEWETPYKKAEVEITLTAPDSKLLEEQLKIFNLLKKPKYKKEYSALKEECHGKSKRYYTFRKLLFFNQMLLDNR